MLDKDSIKKLINMYSVVNGQVFEKNGNNLILDENIRLQVMSAYLIFNEAKLAYQNDVQQFGQGSRNFENYVDKSMEKLSVKGQKNDYGTNKLINSLLTSKGHYEEMISGDNLSENKFSMFSGKKLDYGIAYLKMKYREKGLDIEDFVVTQDRTELQHNGVSKVIINFKIKPYKKENKVEVRKESTFDYEQSDILKDLERQKQQALNNKDEVAVNYYNNSIKATLKNNPISITPDLWEKMNNEQKKRFIELKMKEAKILEDKDAFIYWQNNLTQLQELSFNEDSISRKM